MNWLILITALASAPADNVSLPPVVAQALSRQCPGQAVRAAEFRYIWGQAGYRVDLGDDVAIDVAEDGTLLGARRPAPVNKLPEVVAASASRAARGMTITRAMREDVFSNVQLSRRDRPAILYDVLVMNGDRKGTVIVAQDGSILQSIQWRDPVFVPDRDLRAPLPEKAAAALKQAFTRANILEVEEEQEHGIRFYNVEVIGDGVEQHARVTPDGIILEVLGPVAPAALPDKVRAAAIREGGAGATLGVSHRRQCFASATLKPLDKPRVLYRLDVTRDGAAGELIVGDDGAIVRGLILQGGAK